MANENPYIPFSQRTGIEPIPSQLKLGEVSRELRRLIFYYISLEIGREKHFGVDSSYFGEKWNRVAQDLHVLFLKADPSKYKNDPYSLERNFKDFVEKAKIGRLFDFVEFFIRHPGCSAELKSELSGAFEQARAAYRIIDSQIVAIGTEQQAEAFEAAISATDAAGFGAARSHLVSAGMELRGGNWAGSIRESIHAVEAIAVKLSPSAQTLGPALSKLEKGGHLHGSLKSAFKTLYGYSSDEEGIRHALVFKEEAEVDEADALFMLGACSSFVSYLIARSESFD